MAIRLLWIGSDFVPDLPAIEIDTYSRLESALAALVGDQYDLAMISIGSIEHGGKREVEALLSGCDVPVIVHCSRGSIDEALELMQRGAFHVFIGDIEAAKLLKQIERVRISAQFRTEVEQAAGWRKLVIGQSRSILQVCELIELAAAKRCTILISGETGTGKEVIAKAIHAASNRASQQLVCVNCTALPASLVESELFGHAKGAFTGAHASRLGRFEQAHRGTIFLDEIGDLPIDAQSKLLRVLQEQEFQRVGSSENVRVDVRVIAATNVDLEQAIKEKRFREDLYYRLNVVPIHLPPLRNRREDIPRLIRFFIEKISAAECSQPKQISEEAIEYLQQLDWPGNVRQLEHAVQRAFVLSGDRYLLTPRDFKSYEFRSADFEPQPRAAVNFSPEGINFDAVVNNIELSLLDQALKMSGGNKARAADLLGVKRTTLLAKMKALNYPRENCA